MSTSMPFPALEILEEDVYRDGHRRDLPETAARPVLRSIVAGMDRVRHDRERPARGSATPDSCAPATSIWR